MYNPTIKSNQLENALANARGPSFIKKTPLDTLLCKYNFDDNDLAVMDIGLGDMDSLSQLIEPEDCKTVSVMSLDGIFRGYSLDFDITGMPKFEQPIEIDDETHRDITCLDYLPFTGHAGSNFGNTSTESETKTDIAFLSFGSGNSWPTDGINTYLTQHDTSKAKGVALAGPMIVTGWGVDLWNRPVPNSYASGDGAVFPATGDPTYLEGWRQHSDKWKTGPVDLRWDDMRKVWTFPYIIPGTYNGNGTMQIWSDVFPGSNTGHTKPVFTFFSLDTVESGTKVMAYPICGRLCIIAADCD